MQSILMQVAVETWTRFGRYGDLLAASIAFFSLLSLAPLIVIALSLASLLVDRQTAQAALLSSLQDVASPAVVEQLVSLTSAIELRGSGFAATAAALLLLWAASRLFVQLQDALNLVWGVEERPPERTGARIVRSVLRRLLSFAMVLACGALLVSMLVLHALLSVLGDAARSMFGLELSLIGPWVLLFVLMTALFSLLFRWLPETEVRLSEVWIGAMATATLMLIGTGLLGAYLTRVAPSWLQGAAGALAAFMLWSYYLAQVFLLGAAFTRALRDRMGSATDRNH